MFLTHLWEHISWMPLVHNIFAQVLWTPWALTSLHKIFFKKFNWEKKVGGSGTTAQKETLIKL